MINHRIIRSDFNKNSSIGHWTVDGVFQCFTLEDTDREPLPWAEAQAVSSWKVAKATAIPRGRYKLEISFSQRFQRDMPRVLNVPGFSGILIHWGNSPNDTEGCIIVGQRIKPKESTILDSKIAFNLLFDKILRGGKDQWLTIS